MQKPVFFVALLLAVASSGNALASYYYVEAPALGGPVKSDLQGTYTENVGTWSNTSAKSLAAGCTTWAGARYRAASPARSTFSFVPDETGSWAIDLTWGAVTNGDTSVSWYVSDSTGDISPANGHVLGSGTVNMLLGNGSNAWNPLGSYALTSSTTYTVVLDNPTNDGPTAPSARIMGDAIRLTLVPEPATLALLAMGSVLLACRRPRRS